MDQKNKVNSVKRKQSGCKWFFIAFIAATFVIGTFVATTSQDWHCEQYQGNIPADVSAQFQPGDTVHLGGYSLPYDQMKEGVTYHTDAAAESERFFTEHERARRDPDNIRKQIKRLGVDLLAKCYKAEGKDYYAICAELGLDPNTGNPIGGSATATNSSEKAATVQKKVISHGMYDSLDDNAEKAFVDLLSEGDENNGFIKVKADAEDTTVAAKTVSETKTKGKDGRVEFYVKGDAEKYDQFSYSVTFKQIETDKDVDLKAEFSDIADSQFDDMHAFTFNKQDVVIDMTVKAHYEGAEGQTVYVLTGTNDDDYNTLATSQIDADGNISFDTSNLDKFILTTTDVVSVREAIAKAEAEEQERIEAEKKAEEEKKAAEEAERIKAEEEKKAEEERLAAEAEAAELQRVEAEKQHKMVISGIFAGILLILGLVCFGAIKKSYEKNNNEKTDPKA